MKESNMIALLRAGFASMTDQRNTLRAEVERLQRELATAHADASHYASRAEELRQDAERYRALRRSLGGAPGCVSADMPRVHVPLRTDLTYSPEGLDRAIDAAMRNEQ